MSMLTLSTVLQLSLLANGPTTYAEAHRTSTETGRPLMVLVAADWCSPCHVMKTSVLPEVARRGLLKKVAFAVVNAESEQALASKLMRDVSVPQLIMYRQTAEGWRRQELLGMHSAEEIESFIRTGLEPPVSALGAK